MTRVLSGIQPSGDVHLGNYLGAIGRWVRDQQPESFHCVVDLHAITAGHDPDQLRAQTLDMSCWLLAAGLDPDVACLFVQSQLPEHPQLTWVLSCVATYGELHRMVQFKEKSEGRESVSAGLFTYPVLQAADILLYQPDEVPVGEDQRQHVELTRDVAQRFNARFGETFRLPQATFPEAAPASWTCRNLIGRCRSRRSRCRGRCCCATTRTPPRRRSCAPAPTRGPRSDRGPTSRRSRTCSTCTPRSPEAGSSVIAGDYTGRGYGDFKRDLAEAVNGFLRPVRQRHAELAADPGAVQQTLHKGAARARRGGVADPRRGLGARRVPALTLLTLEAVSLRHAERQVLDEVSLSVAEGDRIGVIGRNGSGKSTLLDLLSGRLPPDEGRRVPARHLRLAVVPQSEELPSALSPVEAVLAVTPRIDADIAGLADRRASAEAVLDRLGLGEHRPVGELSGGQRRRVALAAGPGRRRPGAAGRGRPARPRRADQPPRRRRSGLAAAAPARAAGGPGAGHARPVPARRRRQPHRRGPRHRARRRLRRLRGVSARAGGPPRAGGGDGAAAPQPRPP